MRSLTTKLILAFLAVTIAAVLLVAFAIRRSTETAFNRFLLDSDQEMVVASLTQYYGENGSWENIRDIMIRGRSSQSRERTAWGALADPDGTVLIGAGQYARGDRLSPEELARAVPIRARDGAVVGKVHFNYRPPPPSQNTPETIFLERVRQATMWGAIGAMLLALGMGVVLARTITKPVHQLTEATKLVAAGKEGHQVDITTVDEIGQLASSFNEMSSSLARANQQRRQMTADIAHDLRTPLSIILGYTEALSDGKLAGNREMYGTIHSEARHLSHLIDDLRTLSLADAGELTLNRQSVRPEELLTRAAAAYAGAAQENQITIAVHSDSSAPAVTVDSERMAQVFNNLISNALRYVNPGGRIDLTAQSDPAGVRLEVSDNGQGITADDLPYIFDRFYRAEKSRTENGESGLGLPIVKSIVEAHGGAVTVRSQPGRGTVFSIVLPAAS